jgi:hypothetical protein
VYDNTGKQLSKGTVTIDMGYVNHGIYLNNKGEIFIINANSVGKVNVIRMNLETRAFDVVEIPGSNFKKDELMVQFVNDDVLYVAAVELSQEKIIGVTYSRANFATLTLDKNIFDRFDEVVQNKVIEGRKFLPRKKLS